LSEIPPSHRIPTLYEVDYDPAKPGVSIFIPKPVFERMVYTKAELLSVLGFGLVDEVKVFEDDETLVVFKKNLEDRKNEEEYFSNVRDIAIKAAKEIKAALRYVEVNNDDGYWRVVFDVKNEFADLVAPDEVDFFTNSDNHKGPHIRVQNLGNIENEGLRTKVRIKSSNIDDLLKMIYLATQRIIEQL